MGVILITYLLGWSSKHKHPRNVYLHMPFRFRNLWNKLSFNFTNVSKEEESIHVRIPTYDIWTALDSSFSPKHLFHGRARVIFLFRLSNPPRKKHLQNAEITLCQLFKDGSYERFPTGDFWGMGAFVSPAPLDNKNTSPIPHDSGWLVAPKQVE